MEFLILSKVGNLLDKQKKINQPFLMNGMEMGLQKHGTDQNHQQCVGIKWAYII